MAGYAGFAYSGSQLRYLLLEYSCDFGDIRFDDETGQAPKRKPETAARGLLDWKILL